MDVTSISAEKAEANRLASVVGGYVNETGQLVLVKGDDSEINAGQVVQGIDLLWPVNSVYISFSPNNPSLVLGGGIWERTGVGKFLVGQDPVDGQFDTAGETGGAKTVTLTAAQSGLRDHLHDLWGHAWNWGDIGGVTDIYDASEVYPGDPGANNYPQTISGVWNETKASGSTDALESHNNLPPFEVVYMWRRTS